MKIEQLETYVVRNKESKELWRNKTFDTSAAAKNSWNSRSLRVKFNQQEVWEVVKCSLSELNV